MPRLRRFQSESYGMTFGQLSMLAHQCGHSLQYLSTKLPRITPQQLSTVLPMFTALKEFEGLLESLTEVNSTSGLSIRASSSISRLRLTLDLNDNDPELSTSWLLTASTFPGLEYIHLVLCNEIQPEWRVELQRFLSKHSTIQKIAWQASSPSNLAMLLSLQSMANHIVILSGRLKPDMLPLI
jgi:hypothetical protein